MRDTTILIFAPDDSQDRSNSAGYLSLFLKGLNTPIKIVTAYEPISYFGQLDIISPMNYQEAMEYQVNGLNDHFTTEFMLHCETDGYPINFNNWSDDFLKFDYIGAPWRKDWNLINNGRVGNMGCSIQSRNFREWIKSQPYNGMSGDVFIAQHLKIEAEKNGFTFADIQTALRFSMEHEIEIPWSLNKSFAKHMKGDNYENTISC